ncbi:MAG TPA: hypothetical protein VHK69_06915, partial [Chitinophagaceae bacterium]|nr:hypothetical protein [Chitinophagaceae bacterium]
MHTLKSLLQAETREELKARIWTLEPRSPAQWGRMSCPQMVRHCILFDELMLGRKPGRQTLVGRIFGKVVLRGMLRDERPLQRNLPTAPGFVVE